LVSIDQVSYSHHIKKKKVSEEWSWISSSPIVVSIATLCKNAEVQWLDI